MVIGREFAWGHIGKTGGDATLTMFQCLPDLIEHADLSDSDKKHRYFTQAPLSLDGKRLALNLRRLPSAMLSFVWHANLYGLGERVAQGTLLDPEEAIAFNRPERELRRFLENGQFAVSTWLRMESLRGDFLAFARTLRPVTAKEEARIQGVETKKPMQYDHEPLHYFSEEQIVRLYVANPTWALHEAHVYGDLPVPAAELAEIEATAVVRPERDATAI